MQFRLNITSRINIKIYGSFSWVLTPGRYSFEVIEENLYSRMNCHLQIPHFYHCPPHHQHYNYQSISSLTLYGQVPCFSAHLIDIDFV